jgi:hypothetical protein
LPNAWQDLHQLAWNFTTADTPRDSQEAR